MTPFKNPYKLPTLVNSLFVNLLEDTTNSLPSPILSCHTVKKPTKTNKQQQQQKQPKTTKTQKQQRC